MEDQLLAYNISHGDREAFNTLTHRYYSPLCIFAERILNDPSLAEDIVQEAFVYLWEKRKKLSEIVSVRDYLYTSVRHYSIDQLRSSKVRQRYLHHVTAPVEDMLANYVEIETMRLLFAAIELLPPRTSQVLKLTLEGKKQEQIAAEMDISLATVKALKSDGIKKLKNQLGPLSIVLLSVIDPLFGQ